ncbi:MAG TPA: Ig-like domain-containing protein [Gemmatimonadaceae bacterium]|nr:Ig-like domain-containing protein [Gemmatimonadaceae bacterium]
MRKHFVALTAIGLLGACSGGTDPDDGNRVVTVTVTAPVTSIIAGGTTQATATAITASGTTVANPSVTWSSSAPNVATVSNTGLITGVSVGAATIEARVQDVRGLLSITVTGDPCAAPISISLGEVRTFAGPDQVRCVRLAPTTAPSEYLVVAYNGAETQDERRNVQVAGDIVSASASGQIATLRDALAVLELQRIEESDAIHARIEEVSRKLVEPVMRHAGRAGAALRSEQVAANVVALPPNLGDTLNYRVPDLNPGKNACLDFFPIRAVVKAVGSKAVIVQDVNAPTGGFTATDFNDIVREFDQTILATDTSYFGGPTDRNNDGVIVILYTPEVNKLTPAGSTGFTAGFFFRADMFTKAEFQQAGQTCNTTNEQELFYLLTPDPTGAINNNVRSTATVRQTTRGTIAHELEHMLNQGVRMFIQGASLETIWLDEAMAHFAEEAVGRVTRGFSDFRELNFADASADANDYNAYFRQNFGRFRLWMFRPDTSSPTSNRAATELAPRGAGWALVRYAIDRHSNNNARAFTRALVRGPQTNVANLMARIGSGLSFAQFLGNWMVTNFADHQSLTNVPATYNYVGWNMRSAMTQYNNNAFPLTVNQLVGAASTLVISGSGAYFRVSKGAGGSASTVAMQTPTGTAVDFSGARLTLLRTQ